MNDEQQIGSETKIERLFETILQAGIRQQRLVCVIFKIQNMAKKITLE